MDYLLNIRAHVFPPATYLKELVQVAGSGVSEVLVVTHNGVNLLQDGGVGGCVVVGELGVEGTKQIQEFVLVLKHHFVSILSGVGQEVLVIVVHER